MTILATKVAMKESGEQPRSDVLELFRVPQITIHAFFETPEIATVMESAIADRRMSRAHATMRSGGVAAALEFYRSTATPDLVIFESRARASELFGQLDALANVCGITTKVMVIGHHNDVGLYRGALARGLSDYLVVPLEPMTIIAAISRTYLDAGAAKLGRSLAFVGAKGGVGSSTVAQNVAAAMAQLYSSDIILADLDLPFGSAALGFNIEKAHGGMAQAMLDATRLDDGLFERLLTKCGEHMSVLTAPASLEACYDHDASSFERLLDVARSNVPFVALDVPHVWASWAKKTLLEVDEVVITATPDLVSLRNAKNLIDILRQGRPNDAPPKLVLNQIGVPKRAEIKPGQFADALRLEPIASIRFEPATFSAAANSGRMIADGAAKSAVAKSFATVAQAISGRSSLATNRTGRFAFKRLWGN